jgi:hypothetical protein
MADGDSKFCTIELIPIPPPAALPLLLPLFGAGPPATPTLLLEPLILVRGSGNRIVVSPGVKRMVMVVVIITAMEATTARIRRRRFMLLRKLGEGFLM